MAVREFKLLSCGHKVHIEGFMSSLTLQKTGKHLEPLFLALASTLSTLSVFKRITVHSV